MSYEQSVTAAAGVTNTIGADYTLTGTQCSTLPQITWTFPPGASVTPTSTITLNNPSGASAMKVIAVAPQVIVALKLGATAWAAANRLINGVPYITLTGFDGGNGAGVEFWPGANVGTFCADAQVDNYSTMAATSGWQYTGGTSSYTLNTVAGGSVSMSYRAELGYQIPGNALPADTASLKVRGPMMSLFGVAG